MDYAAREGRVVTVDVEVFHEELLTKYRGYIAYAVLWSNNSWTLEVFTITPDGRRHVITDADGTYDECPDEDMVHDRIDDIIAGY